MACAAIQATLARRGCRLARAIDCAYMFAQANIAAAVFDHGGNGVMPRPYYRPGNYALKRSVGYLMRMSVNRVLPQMETLFQDRELTFSQWTTLVALNDGKITSAGDLAHNICHDGGSLTRLIDQMVERGFVTRSRNEHDRRSVSLALTSRGRAVVEALAPDVMNFWNNLLADFSHAEVDTLVALLTKLMLAAEGERRGSVKLHLSDQPIIAARKKAS
jgi:DNA-binding MarR family transcriptional regulator